MTPITTINIELTDRCNKNCWCCGRRKTERENPDIIKTYGDMPFDMVKDIARQLPENIFVHLHNNGEALLYPELLEASRLLGNNRITHITTNGKLIVERFSDLGYIDTLAISVIENDTEADEQYEIMKEYFTLKGRPYTVIRLNGNVDDKRYKVFNCPIARRNLHNPMGSFDYTKRTTIPETGVCWDMLHHPAINKKGDISICVRYDPKGVGVLGNISEGLGNILYGEKRTEWIMKHIQGKRYKVPLCNFCEYYGIPKGV